MSHWCGCGWRQAGPGTGPAGREVIAGHTGRAPKRVTTVAATCTANSAAATRAAVGEPAESGARGGAGAPAEGGAGAPAESRAGVPAEGRAGAPAGGGAG